MLVPAPLAAIFDGAAIAPKGLVHMYTSWAVHFFAIIAFAAYYAAS